MAMFGPPTIDKKPVSAELPPMEMPNVIGTRTLQLDKISGEDTYCEISAEMIEESLNAISKSGCQWMDTGDPASSPLAWAICGDRGEWVSGHNRNMQQNGQLWPLQVGNKASYTFDQHNASGENKGSRTRTCEVVDQVNIDAYKVICTRGSSDWRSV